MPTGRCSPYQVSIFPQELDESCEPDRILILGLSFQMNKTFPRAGGRGRDRVWASERVSTYIWVLSVCVGVSLCLPVYFCIPCVQVFLHVSMPPCLSMYIQVCICPSLFLCVYAYPYVSVYLCVSM